MDLLRKAVFLGLGAISLTRDKAEAMVDDLIKRGEVASTERYKTVDTLLKEADRQEKEFQRKVNETVERTVRDLGLPSKRDIDDIREALKRIEMQLTLAEKKAAGSGAL